jgi:uncharacterized protein (DUF2141 family)
MKLFLMLFSFFIFTGSPLNLVAQQQGSLIVNIGNINHDSGYFIVSIYKDENTFLKTADQTLVYSFNELDKSQGDYASLTIEQIAFGKFSLGITHDVNSNKKMDTKVFGIPAEPVGFSNNPKNKFGPPKFKQSIFDFSSDKQIIQIDLIEI